MTVALGRDMQVEATRAGASAFARVDVYDRPEQILDVWRELAPEMCGSWYQSEAFLLTWLETCGRKLAVTPFFIVARNEDGLAVALLPLGIFRLGGLRVAEFLGGKHSNYNLGLFRPGCVFSAEDLRSILRQAARRAGSGPHLYRLLNLPESWRGGANPLCLLPHQPAPDSAYATRLGPDGDAFLAAPPVERHAQEVAQEGKAPRRHGDFALSPRTGPGAGDAHSRRLFRAEGAPPARNDRGSGGDGRPRASMPR